MEEEEEEEEDDCQPAGYKSEPPLHWDSSSCDLVYLWDLRCLLDILYIFNISHNAARGRAIISQYNSGMGGDS